jgi:hypothetical protein
MIVDDDNTAVGALSEASHLRFTLANRSPGSAQNGKESVKNLPKKLPKEAPSAF